MNDIFERLKKLCENADMPVPEKSTEAAELKGYAAGMRLVCDLLDKGLANLFVQTCDASGLSEYCSLLSISPGETEENTRKAVIRQLYAMKQENNL